MAKNNLSKKEIIEQRKLRELESVNLAKRQEMLKWSVIGGVALLFVAFFGFLIFSAKQKQYEAANKPVAFEPTGHLEGTASAKLTITEFADFECPVCKEYFPVVQQLLAAYPNQIRLVYKYFPLTTIHKNAMASAQAAEAAGNQGKFWQMTDLLYANQDKWASLSDPMPVFEGYAQKLKLDLAKFREDYASKQTRDDIITQQDEGTRLGVTGTPTFYLNGKQIINPGGFDAFKKIVGQSLKSQ